METLTAVLTLLLIILLATLDYLIIYLIVKWQSNRIQSNQEILQMELQEILQRLELLENNKQASFQTQTRIQE